MDDNTIDLTWPMPARKARQSEQPTWADDRARIQIGCSAFAAEYAGCGTHQIKLTIDISKDELTRLIKELNRFANS